MSTKTWHTFLTSFWTSVWLALTSFWTSDSICIIFILQALLITPFFVWEFSSSERIYYTSQTHQAFQRLKESCFWTPVILVPNCGIGVNHCVPLEVFLIYQWKKSGKFDHMRPRVFERLCRNAIFAWSIFCRSRSSTAGPCGVASNSY